MLGWSLAGFRCGSGCFLLLLLPRPTRRKSSEWSRGRQRAPCMSARPMPMPPSGWASHAPCIDRPEQGAFRDRTGQGETGKKQGDDGCGCKRRRRWGENKREGSTNVGWAKGDLREGAQERKGMFRKKPKRVTLRASSSPSQEELYDS